MDKRVVGSDTVRMLKLGHPWIITDNFTRRWPVGKAGDLVQLTDEADNPLAVAMLDPEDRIVARILSFKQMKLDQDWLSRKLKTAIELRKNHADLESCTAYRLVNAEGDNLPGLTIDRYDSFLMLQLYCEGWRPYLRLITLVLQELLSPVGIYEKRRPRNTRELEAVSDTKKYGRLLSGRAAPRRLEVTENGLKFLVSLEEGLDTGLFLDQRENRRNIFHRFTGRRFLNLFAYTGAFSVAAAAANAKSVTSVDISQGYTEWNRENFKANGIKTDRHRFIVGDCMEKLAELSSSRERFDIILMDPPSFSTSGKGRFTTRGGTSDLVAASLPLLVDGGLLICSSNHRKTDLPEYLKELRRGALQTGSDLRVIQQTGQPADFPYPVTFPDGRYLKYMICAKG